MAGLKSIEAACTTAASSVLDVARDVDGHSRTVTANNAGEAVERFGRSRRRCEAAVKRAGCCGWPECARRWGTPPGFW